MSKWAVIYSSVTGNTKLIAERIAEVSGDADLFDVKDVPSDLSNYEVVAVGYWLKRGGPDPLTAELLPKIQNVNVVLFETHGTEPRSEHAITAFARAAYLIGKGCRILGTFSCQGKVNPAMIEQRLKIAKSDDPHLGSIERWKRAATHPDESDLQAAEEFVATIKRKINLLKKYE
ncbi:MAG: flavodoxin [Selenomonadaceae bacterium]|nr:flavodoxin [Selenomonadaceae bacterium]